MEEQEHYGQIFTDILNVHNLVELRSKSTEEIGKAFGPFMGAAMPEAQGLFLVPTIDGIVLSDGYYKLIDDGVIEDIPCLLGSNKDDILVTPEMNGDKEQSPLYIGSRAFSHKLDELGRHSAYVYYFIRDLPGDDYGAWHSSELWYTMGTMDRCWRPWTEADKALSEQILDYWANFMKCGNPNSDQLPKWEACSQENPFIMEFDIALVV